MKRLILKLYIKLVWESYLLVWRVERGFYWYWVRTANKAFDRAYVNREVLD